MPAMLKKMILAAIDIVVIVVAYLLTNVFKETKVDVLSVPFINSCILAIIVYMCVFCFARIHRSIVRYSSVREYLIISSASIISASLVSTFGQFANIELMSTKTHILAGLFVAMGCVGARVAIRIMINFVDNYSSDKKQKVLIIGAGEATSQVITNINNHMRGEYNVVGIVDDALNKQKTRMYGVEVLGTRKDIIRIANEKDVDLILFAIQNIRTQDKNDILNICNKTKATVKIMLPFEKIIWGKPISETFRDVQVEDLLGRDQIKLDNDGISNHLANKVVLVTGAGGSIGSELCRQIVTYKPKLLVMLDIYENTLYETELEIRRKHKDANIQAVIASVRDKKRLEEIFKEYVPQVVFHAAAHKHVPLMENSPMEAIKNNVFGTYNTATMADKYKAEKFVLISTDKAVNPTNIMGASKRICEMVVQAKGQNSKTKFAAVRFGNVLGSHGSVIPIFKQQIAEGGPITITHKDITRYFMLIPEAVQLILQAMMYAQSGEIFVLDMGKPVKIYDLAQTMIKLSGKKVDIEVTGLRPGEKLYEELLIAEEGLERTVHDKIMVSKIKPITEIELEYKLEKLRTLISTEERSKQEVKDLMKEIVPTYIDVEKEGQPTRQRTLQDIKFKKRKLAVAK